MTEVYSRMRGSAAVQRVELEDDRGGAVRGKVLETIPYDEWKARGVVPDHYELDLGWFAKDGEPLAFLEYQVIKQTPSVMNCDYAIALDRLPPVERLAFSLYQTLVALRFVVAAK